MLTACLRWLGCGAAAVTILMAPHTAWGQGAAYARTSVSLSQGFESNLFGVPASREPQGDLISRVAPVLESGYRSMRFALIARYTMAAERYLRHADLNTDMARQQAVVSIGYSPMQRLRLTLDTSYVQTQMPGEFNVESQLVAMRARATRSLIDTAAIFEWSPVTQVTVDHGFMSDTLAGGVASATQQLHVGVERRTGQRNRYRIDSEFRHIAFSEGAPDTSYLVTTGWTREMSERTRFEIAVGPRVVNGSIRPEHAVGLSHRLRRGGLSVSYARTQLTAIGERGTLDVHRLGATGRYRPTRRLTLTATPSVARSTRQDTHVRVYTFDLEGVLEATRRLTLVATGRLGRQQGTLGGTREAIPSHSLALNLIVRFRPESPATARRPVS